jgi:hypothetical protein
VSPRVRDYDASPLALLSPGSADDFFDIAPIRTDASLCADMARLAYVPERERLERYLGRPGFSLVAAIERDGTDAFVADGQSLSGAPVRVVAFRGTEPGDLRDFLTDASFWPDAWKSGGRVHHGFARALARISDDIQPLITSAGRPVLVTGHSLGAALATLAASLWPVAGLYTLGSPRVGDEAFTRTVPATVHARYVDCCDLVARLPPEGWEFMSVVYGYRHLGPAHFIDRRGDVHGGLSPEEVTRRRQEAGCAGIDGKELFRRWLAGKVPLDQLSDHAPINYVTAILGVT